MRLSTFSVVVALTAESSLVDFAIGSTWERHSVVLQLDDSFWGFTSHVMDCVLVTEPIRSFHCVVHMPFPVIVLHVSQGCIDATLSSDCVRTGGEKFCDDGCFEAFSDEAESCTESSATWSNTRIKPRNLEKYRWTHQRQQRQHHIHGQLLDMRWKSHRCLPWLCWILRWNEDFLLTQSKVFWAAR